MRTFKRISKDDYKKVLLSEQVSSILKFDGPLKFKDPGVPTISCLIANNKKIERQLLDLDSSVNLMRYYVYLDLGLGELKPFDYTLQLADTSVGTLTGQINNVLVKIDKGFFPVNFVVLDPSYASKKIPLILGHPFLAIINYRSDVMDVFVMKMRLGLTFLKLLLNLCLKTNSNVSLLK